MVPPSEFIEAAEESGIIVEIGAWVIDQTCAELARLRAGFRGATDICMSVNVSARCLDDESFADDVEHAMARHGVLTAAILSFAHTLGEFGVVLMVGGNMPGQTQVLSTLIYGHVEAMEYAQAHLLAAGMVVFAFGVLLALMLLQRRTSDKRGRA